MKLSRELLKNLVKNVGSVPVVRSNPLYIVVGSSKASFFAGRVDDTSASSSTRYCTSSNEVCEVEWLFSTSMLKISQVIPEYSNLCFVLTCCRFSTVTCTLAMGLSRRIMFLQERSRPH
jgi:hypothetical protein